jgi:hypothetical protein
MLLSLPVIAALAVASPLAAADKLSTGVTITVKNQTGYYLVEVNRAGDSESGWGASMLGEGVAVRPSRDTDVRIQPGYAKVRALFDVDGTEVEVVEEADFEAGGEYVWTITDDMIWENYNSSDYNAGGDGDGGYGYYDGSYGYYGDSYGYYGE